MPGGGLQLVEQYQVFVYLVAALAGLAAAFLLLNAASGLEPLIWPALAALLYATFCQVRTRDASHSLKNRRFVTASLTSNFILVPGLVWTLALVLPPDPAVRLGVFLVLLVPCTDWFVSFTHLGGGDARLAVAMVPIQLLLQLLLLPLYLWLFLGPEFARIVALAPFLQVFLGLIVAPFLLAALTRYWAGRRPAGARWLSITTKLPVPSLASVVFLAIASQAMAFGDALGALGWAALVFAGYVLAAAPLARLMAWAVRLDTGAGRTLAYNVGSRNSFVVLPLALALPAGWEAAAAAIILQSLMELLGLLGYLWWVPRRLFRGE